MTVRISLGCRSTGELVERAMFSQDSLFELLDSQGD